MARMSAADRKVQILEAAVYEYGRSGIQASTGAVAAQAGVSQPYLFRLFGTKSDLVNAAIEYQTAKLRVALRTAAEHRGPETSPLQALAMGYLGFMETDANSLRCQLHTWAAASDPAIKDVARRTYREIWDDVSELSGAPDEEVRSFMAEAMLLTIVAALDLDNLYGDPIAAARLAP